MSSNVKSLFVLLLGFLLSGCVNTGKLDAFSGYDLQKNQVSKIYLVTDCFMLDEGSESQTLDADYNLGVCNTLSGKIIEDIESQTGVAVINKSVTAGLQAGPNIFVNSAEKDGEHVNLPVHLVDNVDNDEQQFTLNVISKKLSSQIMDWAQREKYVNSLKNVSYPELRVLALDADSAVLFVQLTGLRVDKDRAETKAVLTGVLTLGTVLHVEYSALSASAIMLDYKGNPTWGDAVWFNHEFESECEMNMTKNYLLRYFPASNMNNESQANWLSCISDEVGKMHQ